MVKFIGEPHLLVNVKPPIGTIKHIRFDANGEFITGNELLILRMHHRFDSVPAVGSEPSEEMTDDLELQINEFTETKQYICKKCDFTTAGKGDLMVHYRQAHPKEE
ncbi:hypothetical protein BK133_00800 [Paenibacillus sp. FSL H8-0548]|uniref:hypothetical protein n=1 Tax=Paenibacillus sp. FSL H8-0548 TaxID=1920422 RepID=UPI0009701CF8|nr:hypothetical protein [Paenibacillus sp. FSL H8-0548]OMF38775.1 hypothetical protein BK133_00800 [Paenibacillus sp. FSL H8-0548]